MIPFLTGEWDRLLKEFQILWLEPVNGRFKNENFLNSNQLWKN